MTDIKYISRHISGKTIGWIVQINIKKQKIRKIFTDYKYQSSDWAYMNAIIFVDKELEKLKTLKVCMTTLHNTGQSMKSLGICSVVRDNDSSYNEFSKSGRYSLRINLKNMKFFKSFPVNKFGLENSKYLAFYLADMLNNNNTFIKNPVAAKDYVKFKDF